MRTSPHGCGLSPSGAPESAPFFAAPNAEGCGFGEDNLRQLARVFGLAQHGQQRSRPVLLHLHGHAEYIERAFFQQTIHYVAEHLRIQVIEVGLEHGDVSDAVFAASFGAASPIVKPQH